VRRFIGTDSERGPDNDECLRALHQHLKSFVPVTCSSTSQWEAALLEVMRESKFGSGRTLEPTPPDHVKFLHSLTTDAYYEGSPLIVGKPREGVVLSETVSYEHPKRQPWEDPIDYDISIDDQTPDRQRDRPWHRYVLSKKLLYDLYQRSPFWPKEAPTQDKFTHDVSAFFSRAAALRVEVFEMIVVPKHDDEHEGKVSGGVRVWRFRTQYLRSVLLQDYPSLEPSKSRAKVIAKLEQDIKNGSMFPPLGQ
jgi:hypothetical protein